MAKSLENIISAEQIIVSSFFKSRSFIISVQNIK